MVLTPSFHVIQTDEVVVIKITLPHIRVSNAEVITEGQNFSFYCKPYLLKLTFPGLLQEGEDAHRAVYDPDNNHGTLTVELKKQTFGEHFPDLDLITKLLKSRKVSDMTPDVHEIEVLHNVNFVDGNDDDNEPSPPELSRFASANTSYGFNAQYSNVFSRLREIMVGVLEVNEPDNLTETQRYRQRIAQEFVDFDAARYLGDSLDGEQDPYYTQMMEYKPFWIVAWDEMQKSQSDAKKINPSTATAAAAAAAAANADEAATESHEVFNENEKDTLRGKLKNKEYLIPEGGKMEARLLVALIDLLFAYCYDVRMTEGEPNSESPANIARLSRQLSWLDSYFPATVQQEEEDATKQLAAETERLCQTAITLSMRRLIIYPYLRHWKLGRKILADVARIFLLGKRYLLKCCLGIFHILEKTDNYYLLNTIFLHDYCVWLQKVPDSSIRRIAKAFNNAKNKFEQQEKGNAGKRWVGFHIPELDVFAQKLLQCDTADDDEDEGIEEPEEIPPELLDYSAVFSSSESELAYLQVVSDVSDSVGVIDGIHSEIEKENASQDSLEAARSQLQSMLLSPSSTASLYTAADNSKPLIQDLSLKGDMILPSIPEDEELVPLSRSHSSVAPPVIPTLHPSVTEEIQNALLNHLTTQQEEASSYSDETATEELLLASLQGNLSGDRPQLLTEDDVKTLFASAAPLSSSPKKKVLIEEISSATFADCNSEHTEE